MSLLLHGCLISCSAAETKDRFNYSVLEPIAYRGGLHRRYYCDVDRRATCRQSSELDIKLRKFKRAENFTDVA